MHSELVKENMEQEFRSLIVPLINGLGLCAVVGMIAREVDNMLYEKKKDVPKDWEVASFILDITTEALNLKYEDVETSNGSLLRNDNLTYIQHRIDWLVDDNQ